MPNTTKLCRVAIKDRDRAAIEDCCRQLAQLVVQGRMSTGQISQPACTTCCASRDSLLVAIAFWLRFSIAALRSFTTLGFYQKVKTKLSRLKDYRDQREDSQEQKNDLLITSIPFNKEVAIFDRNPPSGAKQIV
jgi:hypothetical protein